MFEPAPPDTSMAMIGRVAGGTVKFRSAAVEIDAGEESGGLAISFDGARLTDPKGFDIQQSQTNYLIGNDRALWRTHVPNFAKVLYPALYQGIDAVFYGNGNHLEHDFIVRPGADYRQIRIHFPADSQVHIQQDGSLSMSGAAGALRMDAPSIYQTVDGNRKPCQGRFILQADGDIGFTVAGYDPDLDLIIDPVLDFSTYLSPLGSDALAIAADASGNSYVTGYGTLGFPVKPGGLTACTNCTTSNVVTFISKVSADGSKLLYSAVLGGNSFAQPTGIAVDASGDAIVSGWTGASNFPTKSGQPILPQNNNYVGYLVSLSPDGSSLNYGTLLSSGPAATGNSMTYAIAVTIDLAGNAYVTGVTGSGFPVSGGALNQVVTGGSGESDIFLAKFAPTGALVYSAVLGNAEPQNGGGGPIGPSAVAVDTAGDAYITGQAGTLWPITSGAYLGNIAGPAPYATPFVIKVAPDAKSVLYSTYLDYAYDMSAISVLANGNVIVVGNGAGTTYPTTANAYEANSSNGTSFLTELNASGSALVYSTMLCGGACNVSRMAIDPKGNIWLVGQTSNAHYPLLLPLQSIASGPNSVLSEFDPTATTLEFSTFLGGSSPGYASGVAIDPNSRVHVSGAAQYGMYTTPGVYAGSVPLPGPAYSTSTYAYIALIDPAVSAAGLCISPNTGVSISSPLGTSTESKLTITSCGALPLSITAAATSFADFTVPTSEDGCLQALPVGQSCTLAVRFTPSVAGTVSSTLTLASNSPIPAVLPLNGFGTTAPIMTLSSSALTFGPQFVGTQSAAQTITITNTGSANLNGIGFGMLATYQPIFPLTYTCGPSLAPGNSCTFSVAFKPAAIGTSATTVTVQAYSSGLFQQVKLSGTSPAFAIGPQPTGSLTSTVNAGTTAIYALAITAPSAYSGNINLACAGLPANASCVFVPASLAVTGGTPASCTLSIATQSTQAAELLHTGGLGVALAGLLLLMPFKKGRTPANALICFVAMLLLTTISACGGSSSGASSPEAVKVAPGTYAIQVTASDSSGNQSAQPIALIVQ